jgi:hypothetical protein
MAQYGAQFSGDEGNDAGSQFSGIPQESGFQGQPAAFAGFPAYGYTAFPGAYPGAYPATAFPGAYAAAPAPYGATYLPGAEFGAPAAATVLPGVYPGAPAPLIGATTYVHEAQVPIPVRRPGYNERYVAWKNRQKAFNRYTQATKEAIKNSRNIPSTTYALAPATTLVSQPTIFGAAPAAPAYYPASTVLPPWEQYAAAPYGAHPTYIAGAPIYGAPLAFPAATSFGGDFNSYSETSQHVEAAPISQEEPEIRGTQV